MRGFVTLQALAERFYWIKTATNDPFVQNIPKILTASCPFLLIAFDHAWGTRHVQNLNNTEDEVEKSDR